MTIDIDNKYLKKLNDMNQDAKSVFGDGYILCDDILYSELNSYSEKHYGFTDYEFYKGMDHSIPLYIHSRNIYRLIKNIKKQIVSFNIDEFDNITAVFDSVTDDDDLVVTENRVPVKMTNEIATKYCNLDTLSLYTGNRNIYDNAVKVTDYDLQILLNNGLVRMTVNGYMLRITRALIPGLKKSHTVSITTVETEIPDIYEIHIYVNRATMDTLHIYRGFNY